MHLNQYLNAHLELHEHGLTLWDLTQVLPQWKGEPDLPEPFLLSEDDSQPSEWRLAPLDFIYLDAPALKILGTGFLFDLPNLRELYIHAPEAELDLDFLKNLPELGFLQLKCRSVKDQAPLLKLQQLEELILEFRKPDLKALQALPKLSVAYFNPAEPHEVKEFLEQCPDCEVDYAFDEEYAPRFRTAKIGQLYLQYFDYVNMKEPDTLELYIEPLLPWNDHQEDSTSQAQFQEFREARRLLEEQLLEGYRHEGNLLSWKEESDMAEVYMCSMQFQQLLTGHGQELLEALEDFRRLNGSGFELPKIEWWLLKYEDLHRQLLGELDGIQESPARDEDFEYRHCAEFSFLEAFRKLNGCVDVWRGRAHWEAQVAALEQLEDREQLRDFMNREHKKHLGLWHKLRALKLEEAQGQLKLKGYREELRLPPEVFLAARQLKNYLEGYVLWGAVKE